MKRLVTKAYTEPTTARKLVKKASQTLKRKRNTSGDAGEEHVKKRKVQPEIDGDMVLKALEPVPLDSRPPGRSKGSTVKKDTTDSSAIIAGTPISPRRKSMRSTTTAKSVETKKRVQARKKLEAKRREEWKSKQVEEVLLTQEELLAECRITEKINLESLGKK